MVRAAGATHRGHVRPNNEDAFYIDESSGIAILADGMGGQNCGEVGSEITVVAATQHLRHTTDRSSLEDRACEAIRAANREVLGAAALRPECAGMGSTIVMALWRLPDLVIANVGDSRAYLLRAGWLRQLSHDQNFANELRDKLGLSEERLRAVPHRHVLTMAVGTFEQVQVRVHTERVQPGDRILLCSDGLSGPVTEASMAAILSSTGGTQSKVDRLIQAANSLGGPDNITAVLLEFEEVNGGQ